MRVRLTQEALDALRKMQDHFRQDSSGDKIVCLAWGWYMSRPGSEGKFYDHGPGLFVGAFDAGSSPPGYRRIEQDGLEFLLALPPEAQNDRDPDPPNEPAPIDFHRGRFFFL